jgi:hypothetical protein
LKTGGSGGGAVEVEEDEAEAVAREMVVVAMVLGAEGEAVAEGTAVAEGKAVAAVLEAEVVEVVDVVVPARTVPLSDSGTNVDVMAWHVRPRHFFAILQRVGVTTGTRKSYLNERAVLHIPHVLHIPTE